MLHADAHRIVKSVIQDAQDTGLDLADLLPEGRFAVLAFKLAGCERTIEGEQKRAEEGLPEADAARRPLRRLITSSRSARNTGPTQFVVSSGSSNSC